MRFLKLTLRIFGFLTAIAVLLPVLVIATLQVPAGRAFVSGLVSHFASSDALSVSVEDLYVGFNLDAKVESLAIGDAEGDWLLLDKADLTWSPLSLLSGDLNIASLTVGRIDVLRSPSAQGSSSSNDSSGGTDNSARSCG